MIDLTVVSIDPVARARDLARNWRRLPLYAVAARAEALQAIHANGVRLPTEAYDAWLQMSAVVLVGNVRANTNANQTGDENG